MRAFLGLAQAPISGFYRPPPYETGRRREAPQIAGRWLLVPGAAGNLGAPVMSVEAQAYFRSFRVVHALVGTAGAGLGAEPGGVEALSLMASALMILTRCDVLKLIGDGPVTAAALRDLGWGEVRRAWSPRDWSATLADPAGPVGDEMPLVAVDPHVWWETERGARDRVVLAYLEKRMDMATRSDAPRKKRGSVLGRLTRFMRWS